MSLTRNSRNGCSDDEPKLARRPAPKLSVEWEEMLSRLSDLLPDAAERELELEELRRLLAVWQSLFQKLYTHYMSVNPPSAMPVAGYMWLADMWTCIADCMLTCRGFPLAAIDRILSPVFETNYTLPPPSPTALDSTPQPPKWSVRVREEADVPVPVTPSMMSDTADTERRRPRQSAWLVLSPSADADGEADEEEGREDDQAAALNFRSVSVDPSDGAAKHEWTDHESNEAMYKREVRFGML